MRCSRPPETALTAGRQPDTALTVGWPAADGRRAWPRCRTARTGAASPSHVAGGDIVGESTRCTTPTRRRCCATCPAASAIRRRVARPVARRGWLERGPGPSRERGSDAFVELSWDEALDRVAGELRRVIDAHGNAGDLRRLLRLGERRALPPAPEPAAPLPEPARRLHRRRATATASARRSCCCRTSSAAAGAVFRKATSWPVIARAHRAAGRVRRHAAQEHLRRAGRHGAARASAATSPTRARRGMRDRAVQPAARRRGAPRPTRAGIRCVPLHRRRGDARARARAGRPRACTTATSSRAARTAPSASSPTCSATSDGVAKTPEWAERALGHPGRRPARAGAAHGGARARWSPCPTRCSAPSTASSRSGRRSRSPRCSARSACPAAASGTATARWATSAAPSAPVAPADAARRAQPGARVHPGRAHRRHAAAPRRGVRLRRRAPRLPRHPARLLGRRQPVPPPPGPEPAAPRAGAARHDRRARAVLDADGAPRRHRLPGDDVARAQRHRRGPRRRAHHRDAPRGRRRSARRATTTTILAGARRARSASRDAFTEGRDERGWLEHLYDAARGGAARRRASRRRRSTSSGRRARSRCPTPTAERVLFDAFRADPGRAPRCARRAAGSSSSPRPSPASATTTAPATRPGSRAAEWLGAPRARQLPART